MFCWFLINLDIATQFNLQLGLKSPGEKGNGTLSGDPFVS